MRNLLTAGLIFFLIFTVFAQEIPEGGTPVLPEDAATRMSITGGSNSRRTIVPVEGMPFDRAIQGETLVELAQTWDAQFSITAGEPINKDDVLLAVFWARGIESSDETGEVYSEFIFEQNSDPWTKSASHAFVVVGEWRQFFVPFESVDDYETGQAAVKFRLGYKPQIIQIGGLELLNYKDILTLGDMPRTSITYTGMEADAPWRVQAEQKIDTYRKGEIEVTVEDENGNPVQDASVKLRMRKHFYNFGSAVVAGRIMGSGSDTDMYNSIIEDYFNRVVMENDLKWGPWESWDRGVLLDALDWLRDGDIEIRGHCLVWPSWNNTPNDLEANQDDPDYLRNRVMDHIEDEAGELAGLLVDWDVINENYWNHDIMDILGDEVMVDWFKKTREMDANAKLYLNDNNLISAGGIDQIHQDFFINTVQYLIDNGAPIDGIGTQCHFGSNPTPPTRIWSILDRLDDFGLEIQATEFDINTNDPELQVNYTRDFMTAYFAHPSTVGILMWGFWARQHWRPEAALWDADWNLMPHGEAWLELVTETWWTNEDLSSNADGRASTRAFLGDYDLEVTYGGITVKAGIPHETHKSTVNITGSNVDITHGHPTYVTVEKSNSNLSFGLGCAYPNPFNPDTVIPYTLPDAGQTTLNIYNSNGQHIRTLIDGFQQPGHHTIEWDGLDDHGHPVTSGIYLVRMSAGKFSQSGKLTLLQ